MELKALLVLMKTYSKCILTALIHNIAVKLKVRAHNAVKFKSE